VLEKKGGNGDLKNCPGSGQGRIKKDKPGEGRGLDFVGMRRKGESGREVLVTSREDGR